MHLAQKELRRYASPARAEGNKRFFKTGKGQYGEGDCFIGVTVPDTRLVAKKFQDLSLDDIQKILSSPQHEDRLLALLILVQQFERENKNQTSQPSPKLRRILKFFLRHRRQVNNWDLVDLTAAKILGEYCRLSGEWAHMKKLVKSKRHWDRRLAIVATHAFIRRSEVDLTFSFSQMLLNDSEDLMHKASGWMLREAGKKNKKALERFIENHGKKMPRTMLRYAIEKWSPERRQKILSQTKK